MPCAICSTHTQPVHACGPALADKILERDNMALIRSSDSTVVVDFGARAPMFEYADADGNTFQLTEADAARRPGLTRLGEIPPTPQRRHPGYDATGVAGARQVGDASRA